MKTLSRALMSGASVVLIAGAVGALAVAVPTGPAFAQAAHTPHKAHPHHHKSGHDLVAAKLHQDGKHDIDKTASGKAVSAEVKGGKVGNMTAAGQPMIRVKSHKKMASAGAGFMLAGYQLAQYDSGVYYGYCVDDGVEVDCYWYDASDVDTSGDWEDYDTWDAAE